MSTTATPQTADRKQEFKAAFRIIVDVGDAIRAAGAQGCPEGPLYAAVMRLVTLEGFQSIMNTLVNAGLIRRAGHVAYWVEPAN